MKPFAWMKFGRDFRCTTCGLRHAYVIERDLENQLYVPKANGEPIRTGPKLGYYTLADAKRACMRHAAQSPVPALV